MKLRCCALTLGLLLVGTIVLVSCSHSQPVQVLQALPPTPVRTLGMVSGHGANDASAMAMVIEQAERLEADAVVVERSNVVGSQVVISARAITFLAPPPAAPPPAE